MGYYINKIIAAWLTWVSIRCVWGTDNILKVYEDILEKMEKNNN